MRSISASIASRRASAGRGVRGRPPPRRAAALAWAEEPNRSSSGLLRSWAEQKSDFRSAEARHLLPAFVVPLQRRLRAITVTIADRIRQPPSSRPRPAHTASPRHQNTPANRQLLGRVATNWERSRRPREAELLTPCERG